MIKYFLFSLFTTLILISSQGYSVYRGDDDFNVKTPTKTTKNIQYHAMNDYYLQKVGTDRLALAIEQIQRNANSPEEARGLNLINALLDQQFQNLIRDFPEDIQASLTNLWNSNHWIQYSHRAEHTLEASPLGQTVVYGRQTTIMILDERIKGSPTLERLLKMIALTHVIGPRLKIIEERDFAFYRASYETQEILGNISSYWTLIQWLQFVQIGNALQKEIRQASAPLATIKYLLEYVESKSQIDGKYAINTFIATHTPQLAGNEVLRGHLQIWLNDATLRSGFLDVKPRTEKAETRIQTKIIDFQTKKIRTLKECLKSIE